MKSLIGLLILCLLLPKSSKSKKETKKSRPWYDISYDDMIMYDIFEDD